MKYVVVILFFVILFSSCKKENIDHSAYFTKFFGSSGKNNGKDLLQLSDGGYLILGEITMPGRGLDIALIKTDANGNSLWTKTFGDTLDDWASSIIKTSDNEFAIVGTTTVNSDDTDILLIKINSNGDVLLNKKFIAAYKQSATHVLQTKDNSLILTGSTTKGDQITENEPGKKDIILYKTTINGDSLWCLSRGGANDDEGKYIIQKSDGGYTVVATTESFTNVDLTLNNILIVETNQNGAIVDMYPEGGAFDDFGECIAQLSDGSYIISGTKGASNNSFVQYIRKTQGPNIRTTDWIKEINAGLYTESKRINITNDDKIVVTGAITSNGSKDISLYVFDKTGAVLINKIFGDFSSEEGVSVISTSDKGFAIVGTTALEGPSMICVLKLNQNGEQK